MELSAGSTETNTKVSSRPTTSKATAGTSGSTAENSKVFGKITKCTEREPSSGATDANMKANISMRRKKDTESSHGPMEDATKVNGKMENKTARVFTGTRKESKGLEFGQTARKLNGLIDKFMLFLASVIIR